MTEHKNIYEYILKQVEEHGSGILLDTNIHGDIPTIHDVGRDRLPTDSPVKHIGHGCFTANVGDGTISFDGGGWMNKVYAGDGKYLFGWTYLRATADQRKAMGYDLEKVKAALAVLSEEHERKHSKDGASIPDDGDGGVLLEDECPDCGGQLFMPDSGDPIECTYCGLQLYDGDE